MGRRKIGRRLSKICTAGPGGEQIESGRGARGAGSCSGDVMDVPGRDQLPAELRAFLYSCIDAVEQVEILMLLRGTSRAWTAREVTRELALVEPTGRVHLEVLTARGLLQATSAPDREVAYRLAPRTVSLAGYVELLAECFAQSRSAIHRFVVTRCGRSKSFADAFKLRDPES
jgi:hypothetical protein